MRSFLALEILFIICGFHVRFWSIVTPKYFISVTYGIVTPFSLSAGGNEALLGGFTTITYDFEALIFRPLALNHSLNSSSAACRIFLMVFKS